jgi:hypothetical protein
LYETIEDARVDPRNLGQMSQPDGVSGQSSDATRNHSCNGLARAGVLLFKVGLNADIVKGAHCWDFRRQRMKKRRRRKVGMFKFREHREV